MERENFRPTELTGEAQNTYSGSMDPRTEAPPQPNNIEANVSNIRQQLQQRGVEVDANSMQTIRIMAEAGLVNLEGQSRGQRLVDPRGNPIRTGEVQVREGPPTPEVRQAVQQEVNRENRDEKQTAKDEVLKWIFDPAVREQYFNDIYALVDSRPNEFWERAFNIMTDGAKEEEFMKVILEGSRGRWGEIVAGYRGGIKLTAGEVEAAAAAAGKDLGVIKKQLEEDFFRYQQERAVRSVLHNVNAVLYLPSIKADQLYEQMQQFQSSHGDIAFKMPGVRDMMSLYEEALYECMSENQGYLDPEAVLGTVTAEKMDGRLKKNVIPGIIETRVKDRFKRLMDAGLIVARTDQIQDSDVQINNLEQWEIDRTFTMARGMMIMSERLIEIAAESRLPKGATKYSSLFLQDVVQGIAPYRHLLAKFDIPEEGLAALLFDSQQKGLFSGWNPKDLKKVYEDFHENPDKFMETIDKFYIGRINPNRAGSIWSWVSWRASEDPTTKSALQRFLQTGRNRMKERWIAQGNTGEPPPDYLDEYQKWTGTGFRFEKLRGDLEKIHSHEHEDREKGEIAMHKAEDLFDKITTYQTHRLYLSSINVRRRVLSSMNIDEANMTEPQKDEIRTILGNLSAVESAFLRNREKLLDEGKSFDTITAADMEEFYEIAIPDASEREKAKEFAARIKNDFNSNKEAYWNEYIYKREYNHGFVLWTGDVPVDEYNMSAVGPTGGFARRARDNTHQAKAAGMEVGLLDNLKNLEHPDQLVSALYGMWAEIDGYDRAKARQAIAEKAEGIIKFYKAGWLSKMPGGFTRKTSFARQMYGPHAAAWESSDINYFIDKMEHAKMIDEEQSKKLRKLTGATKKHVVGEGLINIGQFILMAIMTQIGESVLKDGFSDIEGV